MKIRKFSILFLAACLFAGQPMMAQQDARHRTAETIVSDGLAQLPTKNPKTFNQIMGELAGTGQQGIKSIAAMMTPNGKNATFEYAISGIVDYATAPANQNLLENVRLGLIDALNSASDNTIKSYLMTQLVRTGNPANADVFTKYLSNNYLQDFAISALANTPGIDDKISQMVQAGTAAPKDKLAYLAYFKQLKDVEPTLLSWLNGADERTQGQIYNALTVCGTSNKALAALQKAAKAAGYNLTANGATDSYLQLLNNLNDTKVALKNAKGLLKADKSAIRCAGLRLLLKDDAANATKNILSALKDNDIQYRNTALQFAKEYAGDGIFQTVASKFASFSDDAKADVVSWLGNNKVSNQIDVVTSAIGSNNDNLAKAAIEAAGRIGGNKALTALFGALEGKNAAAANAALLAFNGDINSGVQQALNSTSNATLIQALKLAQTRKINSTYDKVLSLTNAGDASVKQAAFEALQGVAKSNNFGQICDLMEKASGNEAAGLSKAAQNAIQSESADQQFNLIQSRLGSTSKAALYYPLLAQAGNSSAIKKLQEEYAKGSDKAAAFQSLLKVNNPEMIGVLYNLAKENSGSKDAVLQRYLTLVKGANKSAAENYLLCSRALDLNPGDKVASSFVSALGSSKTLPALTLAAKYLDNKATASAAATTVKDIVAKTPDLQQGAAVKNILTKAQGVFSAAKAGGDADAGYAVDEIAGILNNFKTEGGYVDALSGVKGVSAGSVELPGTYENFELYLEWDGTSDAVLNVRSMPLVKLEAAKGVSYVYGKEKVAANKGWNLIYVKMLNDRIFIQANGQKVVENAIVKNVPETKKAEDKGGIKFESVDKAAPAKVRNFYVNKLPDTPIFVLPEEEAKQGFEVLFDGRSLEKWHGNTSAYVPVDGNIYVTANYGGTGNLYTKKNYSDFIFRFEFWFDVPAVNNGIGIRTGKDVTGVDAAYEGMEIQVLDHDNPVYKGLRPYQNHGSVYGIVVPKHANFGPIKQWHTEEIKAIGDHITVTVDGVVLTDANIREACQGHNVAPDGSGNNPYTVDHKNHPGLFNKEGYISFCGHGAGVKFRNVRVLDLSKDAQKSTAKSKKRKK